MEIKEIVLTQREYFNSRETYAIDFRKIALTKLKQSILENMPLLLDAFKQDFNKYEFDVVSTEVGLVLNEIKFMLKHLRKLTKPKRQKTSILNFPSKGFILQEPYGVTLVVAPWNYPFQLSMAPLVGAIAAGNTVVLKPSNYAPKVAEVIKKILSIFDDKFVSVVLGGREENQQLFEQKFDFIFFTGGTVVAKVLMEKASQHLTPCCFELGGKSPCIVDYDCALDLAAKRIVWGKYLNAGQTCVAPDYILVHKDVKNQFVEFVIKYIKEFYYVNGELTSEFCHIINDKHALRLGGLIDKDKLAWGGKINGRIIEPTVLTNVDYHDKVMGEEIFGPIMPIIEFDNINKVVEELKSKEKPLALYYFGQNKKTQNFVMNNCCYGGGCVNDTIMHLTEEKLPFGGVGFSGMGSYHGKKSFETFSHAKSVLKKATFFDLNVRYMPTSKGKTKLAKFMFGIKK